MKNNVENFINKVTLQGQVGSVRSMSINNTLLWYFSLATTRIQKLPNETAVAETTWHMVQYKETPENPLSIEKGDIVKVEGFLRTSRYTNHNGEEKTFTEVVAETAEIVKKA